MVLQLVLVLQPVLPVKINIQLTSLWNLSREDRYDCNRFVTIYQAVNVSISMTPTSSFVLISSQFPCIILYIPIPREMEKAYGQDRRFDPLL